jgi:hypothetical protein
VAAVVDGQAVGAVAGTPELDVDAEVAANGRDGMTEGAEAVGGPGSRGVDRGIVGRGTDERAQ